MYYFFRVNVNQLFSLYFFGFLKLVPNNIEVENELLTKMKNFGLSPDIDFINFLIRRRIERKQSSEVEVRLYI